jgi:hypothetical protein
MKSYSIAALFLLAAHASPARGQPGALDPGALDQWKRDAEALSGAPIQILRIGGMPLALPGVVARALGDESFRRNLAAAHALTIHWDGVEKAHYVLLNMALAAQWKDAEEGLLAHEIGHIWLNAAGYRTPPYESGPVACLSVISADIPQHILIRAEVERRGIAASRYWLGNLELAKRSIEGRRPTGRLDPCQKLVVLSQWMDARLGASPDSWTEWDCFESLYAKTYPSLKPHADALASLLRPLDLRGREQYQSALRSVRERLEIVLREPD